MQNKIISPDRLAQILCNKTQNRFWSKVLIKGPNDCWLWSACKNKKGYGNFGVCLKGWQSTFCSHQIAWISKNKIPIPSGKFILHSCIGSRSCCNPDHLRIGTQRENMQDMRVQGRNFLARGESSGMAKLNNDAVIQIKKQYATGAFTNKDLGIKFRIDPSAISRVVNGKVWGHVQEQ